MTRSGYEDEIAYWARELALEGAHREHTERRLSSAGRRDEHPVWIDGVLDFLERGRDPQAGPPRAVDLGCGPLGTLGWAHESGRLDVTGVDPLAPAYEELRSRYRIDHPEPLLAGTGERLDEVVPPGSVDLVYSRNSLDHAEDPQRCFDAVARVLRPGGVFALEVFAHEGFREAYDGLHRFDFHVHGDALGCTDEQGREALDLSSSELVLVALAPLETPRPAGVGADTTTVRAVFARTREVSTLRRLALDTWLGEERARVVQLVDPAGVYAARIAHGWDVDLMRAMFPAWAEPLLAGVRREGGGPVRALEVDAGSMPTLTWAAQVGLAEVRAADPQAAAFRRLFDERLLPAHPVAMVESSAADALAAAPAAGLEVVHLRDALARADDPAELLARAARALAPGGVLLAEGAARGTGGAPWRHPFGGAVRVQGGHLVAVRREGGAPRALPLDAAALGLEPLLVVEVDAADPLREPGPVYRVAYRRSGSGSASA